MGKPCFAELHFAYTPKLVLHFAELVPPPFLLKYYFFNHFVEFPAFHIYTDKFKYLGLTFSPDLNTSEFFIDKFQNFKNSFFSLNSFGFITCILI